jgi:PDZ domain-containing protein
MTEDQPSGQATGAGFWPMAPVPPEHETEDAPRLFPRWAKFTIAIAVLMTAVFVAGFLIHVPYTTISPGEAVPLTSLVHVDGAQTFDAPRGDIRLLFVRERNHVNLWRFLAAQFDSDTDVLKDKVVNPNRLSPSEQQQLGQNEMDAAKLSATKVALEAAGYKVPATIVVSSLRRNLPAAKVLHIGDVIDTADGVPIRGDADLRHQIAKHDVGDTVELGIVRGGKKQTVRVGIAESDGSKVIGVLISPRFNFPLKVSVDTAGILGPSGGLAMTLAILDDLTPGNLTGGKRVAVTGTIDADGNVGEIGGIEQKAVAAKAAHVQLFIVPQCGADDPPDALAECKKDLARAERRVGSNVKVQPVSTFDEALNVLRQNGGDPVVKVAPGAKAA